MSYLSQIRSLVFATTLVLLSSGTIAFPADASAKCKFQIEPVNGVLPIVVNQYGKIAPKFDAKENSYWVEIPSSDGHEFSIFCRGDDNKLGYFGTPYLAAKCDTNGLIQTEYGPVTSDQLKCSIQATETVERNGTCFNGKYTKIHIAFPNTNAPFIEVCHSEDGSETIYAKHTLNGPKLHEGESINRPSFKESIFYPNIDADNCYKQATQIATIGEILGSTSLANQYIQPGKNLFLSRGHMTPNGDGIPADEKRATFYFVNASPQWQTINGGNWNELEIKLRNYAEQKQAVLTVWTGAWGVSTLKDAKGADKEIYLGKDSKGKLLNVLPIPRGLYKVIHNEKAGTGVVVLQINNPYAENHKSSDIICPDICDQIPWVTWDVDSVQKGYTYCCDVASFAKAMPGRIPDLGKLSLLK